MDKDKARNKLWEQYTVKKTAAVREQLILEYVPLVKIVAGRLSMYLGYAVEFDDLVGYGVFGLIDRPALMCMAWILSISSRHLIGLSKAS